MLPKPCKGASQNIIIINIIIIIIQTATPLVRANCYKPKGTSRESNPVRKGKKHVKRDNKYYKYINLNKTTVKTYVHYIQKQE